MAWVLAVLLVLSASPAIIWLVFKIRSKFVASWQVYQVGKDLYVVERNDTPMVLVESQSKATEFIRQEIKAGRK